MSDRILAFRDLIYSDSHVVSAARERERLAESLRSNPVSRSENCAICKRVLIPGALYADGFRDGKIFCHRCKRDAFEGSFVEAEESIEHRDDFPRR